MAGKIWTQEENNILIEKYPVLGKKKIQTFLPHRTQVAVNIQASKFWNFYFMSVID